MNHWRIALRSLLRRPAYSAVASLILALGIAATTTLFSVVDTILLKPLPYPAANQLVTVYEASPSLNKRTSLIAPARLEDWNRLNQTFQVIAGYYAENVTDTSGSEPQRLDARRVTPRFFDVYEATPVIGRTFVQHEEVFGGPGAAVISYGLWSGRYAQDRAVLGKQLILAGQQYTIIGVMPKDFAASSTDLWVPAQTPPFLLKLRDARFLAGVGRMKPGVSVAQAQGDLARVQQQLGEQFPQTDKSWSAIVADLKDQRVGDYRRNLLLVLGSVALLLLIAVINIAGLTLAQLHQRQRDFAIRTCIGASRADVVYAVMREILLISLFGAAIGAAVAAALVRLVPSQFPDLPRINELTFDWRALAFAIGISLAAAIFFGAIPALQATRRDLAPMLAEAAPISSSGRRALQSGLVVAQLGLTVVLLSSASLLLRSYRNLSRVDLGFDTANTVTFHVGAAWSEDRPRVGRMQLDIISALQRVPGVEAAGMTNFLPATGATLNYQITLEGLAQNRENGTFTVGERTVDSGYLRSLKIPVLAGSYCSDAAPVDNKNIQPVTAVVNRRFVDVYTPGQNIIGRHFRFSTDAPTSPGMEITGIVGDAREDGISQTPTPYVYVCLPPGSWPDPEYTVRTQGDPRALMRQIASIVHGVDPTRAVFGVHPLDVILADALEQPRLNTGFLTAFAAAAMLLASIGLYGLMALVVRSQTREIGIRIALGARKSQTMQLILVRAARLLAIGVALGLALAFLVESSLKSLLYGVSPLDAASLAASILLLSLVCALAAFIPAREAASVDPIQAIRTP
jgi:putative ABC transport system permease protein